MNETLQLINDDLRTIHGNFSEKEVSEKNLETILQSSLRAPNAGNMQTYSIVVVKNRPIMKKLCVYTGSVALVFCVDHTRVVAAAKQLGSDFSPKTIGWFITGSTDTILAAQTAAIAAKSMGIDTLYTTSLHRGDYNRIYEILDIPEKFCFPIITLILGYPKKEPGFKKGRIEGKGLIHYEKYEKQSEEEIKKMIGKYDSVDEHLGISVAGRWENDYPHYLSKILSFWGDGGADKSTKQLYKALIRTGYLDSEES